MRGTADYAGALALRGEAHRRPRRGVHAPRPARRDRDARASTESLTGSLARPREAAGDLGLRDLVFRGRRWPDARGQVAWSERRLTWSGVRGGGGRRRDRPPGRPTFAEARPRYRPRGGGERRRPGAARGVFRQPRGAGARARGHAPLGGRGEGRGPEGAGSVEARLRLAPWPDEEVALGARASLAGGVLTFGELRAAGATLEARRRRRLARRCRVRGERQRHGRRHRAPAAHGAPRRGGLGGAGSFAGDVARTAAGRGFRRTVRLSRRRRRRAARRRGRRPGRAHRPPRCGWSTARRLAGRAAAVVQRTVDARLGCPRPREHPRGDRARGGSRACWTRTRRSSPGALKAEMAVRGTLRAPEVAGGSPAASCASARRSPLTAPAHLLVRGRGGSAWSRCACGAGRRSWPSRRAARRPGARGDVREPGLRRGGHRARLVPRPGRDAPRARVRAAGGPRRGGDAARGAAALRGLRLPRRRARGRLSRAARPRSRGGSQSRRTACARSSSRRRGGASSPTSSCGSSRRRWCAPGPAACRRDRAAHREGLLSRRRAARRARTAARPGLGAGRARARHVLAPGRRGRRCRTVRRCASPGARGGCGSRISGSRASSTASICPAPGTSTAGWDLRAEGAVEPRVLHAVLAGAGGGRRDGGAGVDPRRAVGRAGARGESHRERRLRQGPRAPGAARAALRARRAARGHPAGRRPRGDDRRRRVPRARQLCAGRGDGRRGGRGEARPRAVPGARPGGARAARAGPGAPRDRGPARLPGLHRRRRDRRRGAVRAPAPREGHRAQRHDDPRRGPGRGDRAVGADRRRHGRGHRLRGLGPPGRADLELAATGSW